MFKIKDDTHLYNLELIQLEFWYPPYPTRMFSKPNSRPNNNRLQLNVVIVKDIISLDNQAKHHS